MNLEVQPPGVYIFNKYVKGVGFPGGSVGKESTCNAGDTGRCEFDPQDPQVGKILWRRAWQPTPVFLPGESHGQRSLVDSSPWGRKGQA